VSNETKSFLLRLPPDVHSRVVAAAEKAGVSVNTFIVESAGQRLAVEDATGGQSIDAIVKAGALLSTISQRLAAGYKLVSPADMERMSGGPGPEDGEPSEPDISGQNGSAGPRAEDYPDFDHVMS
jgi:hypothetical protein